VHAGLAVSLRGAHGGFALARPASEITMRDVIEAVDGPIALNQCVASPEDCPRNHDCEVHKVWLCAQDQLMGVLGTVSLQSLAPAAVV